MSCGTLGKYTYRRPLTSKFNQNVAPYRNRYQTTTSKPQFNAKHFIEKDQLQKQMQAANSQVANYPLQEGYTVRKNRPRTAATQRPKTKSMQSVTSSGLHQGMQL